MGKPAGKCRQNVHDLWIDVDGRGSASSSVDFERVAFGTATFLTSRWRQLDGRSAGHQESECRGLPWGLFTNRLALPRIIAQGNPLVLPALAYAGSDNGKGNDGTNNGKGNDGNRNGKHIPVVPETNPAWVLVPFFGAVLLFSSRRFLSANLAKK
jgi:hypothetical protein